MKISRLFDIPYHQKEKFNQPDALAAKREGKWVKYSTDDLIDHANKVSLGLRELGIKKDDKVAIISNNRPEWNFADFGILQLGAVNVPIYPTISEEEFKFIFNDAEVKVVFVSDEELYKKVEKVADAVPTLLEVYTFDRIAGAKHWTELLDIGKKIDAATLEGDKENIKSEDLATIIYTSGTTGTPKGVMLSHKNIISNVENCLPLLPVNEDHRALSFLPLNHIFERMLTYLYMSAGVSIYYAESIEMIGDNLKEVQPHIFTTVPRLLEKVYDKIVGKGMELTGLKKGLFFWALNLGLKYEMNKDMGMVYNAQLKLANKLIFSKWREALGGNIICVVSGGAALQPRLAKVFTAAQIPVLEGYGLTETSPVIAVNRFEEEGRMSGTVGPVIPGVEVKIAEDGEICCKGSNVMIGYYKRQDLTDEVLDNEGWLHTGDVGEFITFSKKGGQEYKFLKITDRKKELFKTSGGKYVAPQPVENKFKESLFIEQIMVIGEGEKFVSALIVPAFLFIKEWCRKKNINCGKTNEEIIANEQVKKHLYEEVESLNKNFGHVEQIKKFRLVPDEWAVDTKELTPTMKLKRKTILNKYKDVIEEIYGRK